MDKDFERAIADAFNALTHGCDGPVTNFVVISRAIELARTSKFTTTSKYGNDALAEALNNALYGDR